MSSEPLVSVLIPAHNEERYIVSALRSVLEQTYRELEVVVVDDCSTDRTPELLQEFVRADSRVRVLTNQTNLGLTKSLNRGLDEVRGSYIARMDADDICMPARIARQVEVMRGNPEVVLCGTGTIVIDEHGRPRRVGDGAGSNDPALLKWYSVFRPVVSHSTAMFSSALLGLGLRYDENFRTAQDYEFWWRVLEHGKVVVVQEPLLRYRSHPRSVSNARRAEQVRDSSNILKRNLREFGARNRIDVGAEATDLLAALIYGPERLDASGFRLALAALAELEASFVEQHMRQCAAGRQRVRAITARWLMQSVGGNSAASRAMLILWLLKRPGSVISEVAGYFSRRYGHAA